MTDNHLFTVYYDGSCPLCVREIGFYRKLRGADAIEWQDVSTGLLNEDDLSCEAAMARFHVRTRDGQLIDGGRAFVALWRQLPAFRIIGVVCSFPFFRWIIDRAYNAFLPIRPHLQRFARQRNKEST
ncbi:MAG: DUF393 domain-containing protein [Pseudomonadota bacterium]